MKIRKSYYFTILSRFLIGALVPVIAILVLNLQSLNVVREQTVLSNQNTLQQVVRLLDYEVEDMSRNCVEIARFSDVRRYPSVSKEHRGEAAMLRYNLKQQLKEYVTGSLKDVLVYFPTDGYIVSGFNGSLKAEDYYQTYYGKEAEISSGFLSNLTAAPSTPTVQVINPGGEQSYLSITVQGKGHGQEPFAVSFVLADDYLNQLQGSSGSLLLFDKDKQLLLSGSRERIGFHMDDYADSSVPYETSFGGEKYIMQVYHSEVINCYFAFATPSAYFWEQLSQMQLFSLLGVVLCVVMSIVLAWITSKRAYRPVEEFVESLCSQKDASGYERLKTNEFEFMRDYFRKETRENRKLSKENIANLRDRLILQVLEGKVQGENGNAEVMEKVGAILLSDRFISGIIQVEQSSGWKHSELSFTLRNVFEEIFNRTDLGYLVYIAEHRYAFLINLAVESGEDHVFAMLTEAKSFLKTQLGLEMTIGCSNIEEGLLEIGHTYDQAKTALRYRYIYGECALIFFKDLEGRQFAYRNITQGSLYARLDQYINRDSDSANAGQLVGRIFEEHSIGKNMSMETMECFKFDVVNSIIHIGLEYNLPPEGRQEKVESLLGQQTLREFGQYLEQALEELRQERLEQQESAGICASSRAYIEKHYSDPQMSMAYVSESMGVSASYLSRLYKQKYGLSVLQDITRVRLVNAKRLLQDTELNVAEISEKTGFSNSNVFIKVFKKWEGMTPGQYKELYRTKP